MAHNVPETLNGLVVTGEPLEVSVSPSEDVPRRLAGSGAKHGRDVVRVTGRGGRRVFLSVSGDGSSGLRLQEVLDLFDGVAGDGGDAGRRDKGDGNADVASLDRVNDRVGLGRMCLFITGFSTRGSEGLNLSFREEVVPLVEASCQPSLGLAGPFLRQSGGRKRGVGEVSAG